MAYAYKFRNSQNNNPPVMFHSVLYESESQSNFYYCEYNRARHGAARNGTERHRLRLYRHFGSVCYALILPLLICQAKKGNRCRKRYTKTGILTDIFYMQERRFLYFFNRIPVRTSLSSLILSVQFCI